MKKISLFAVICTLASTSSLFAQQTQSLSFSAPGPVFPGSTFNVSVTLSFSGYESFGLSYWLEVDNALAPFLAITHVTYFSFPDPNQTSPNPAPFNSTAGSTAGFMCETRDLGATVNGGAKPPPPPYHITDLQFTLGPNAPSGTFIIRSTTVSPRISEVSDTQFNDHNIIPAGSFTISIIPEPGTLSLLGLGIIGCGLTVYLRRSK